MYFFTLTYLTFLTHFAPFAAMMVILAVIYFCDLAAYLYRKIRTPNKNTDNSGGIRSLKDLIFQAFLFMPVFFLGIYHVTYSPPGNEEYRGTDFLLTYLWEDLTLVTYTDAHKPIVRVVWIIIILAVLSNIIVRIIREKAVSQRDVMLIGFGCLLYLYFSQPWTALGSSWINERILLVLMLILFVWYEPFPKLLQIFFGSALFLTVLWQLYTFSYEYSLLQPKLKELTQVTDMVEPHSTLSYETKGSYFESLKAHTKNVSPLHHMICYYGLKKDVVNLSNYEAYWHHFYVNWRHHPDRREADYLLQSDHGHDEHDKSYEIIYQTENVKLLRKKQKFSQPCILQEFPDGRKKLVLKNKQSLQENIRRSL